MQKREVWRIAIVVICLMCLFISQAVAVHEAWDCPDCGRTGNTGNYCGGCAHPAPWIESSTDPAPTDIPGHVSPLPSVREGDIIRFGTYPQTKEGNDQTPIEWIVLDYDEANHKVLLLSKYGLDAKLYNTKYAYTGITWEKCTMRAWLNGEFLNKAFSAAEQSAILTTAVDNSKSQGYSGWNTNGGNNTEDQIFLLSYAEANRYLNVTFDVNVTVDDSDNLKSRVAPTAYVLAQGAWTSDSYKTAEDEAAGSWWLRSPGRNQGSAAFVSHYGSLLSYDVSHYSVVVRPAFWLDYDLYNKADSSVTEKDDATIQKYGETGKIPSVFGFDLSMKELGEMYDKLYKKAVGWNKNSIPKNLKDFPVVPQNLMDIEKKVEELTGSLEKTKQKVVWTSNAETILQDDIEELNDVRCYCSVFKTDDTTETAVLKKTDMNVYQCEVNVDSKIHCITHECHWNDGDWIFSLSIGFYDVNEKNGDRITLVDISNAKTEMGLNWQINSLDKDELCIHVYLYKQKKYFSIFYNLTDGRLTDSWVN